MLGLQLIIFLNLRFPLVPSQQPGVQGPVFTHLPAMREPQLRARGWRAGAGGRQLPSTGRKVLCRDSMG